MPFATRRWRRKEGEEEEEEEGEGEGEEGGRGLRRTCGSRHFHEGASPAFRRGTEGWHRTARSLGRAFHNYALM